jgi:HSP90 family molecular chaperone
MQTTKPGSLPIGQFGIGILSAFMIGDELEINTKMEHSPGVYIGIPGVRDYFVVRESDRIRRGTKVSLRLNSSLDVKEALEKYIVRPRCPIEVTDIAGQTDTIDSRPDRLWRRLRIPKNLSGHGEHFGFPVSVRGKEFEGQFMVILPGDKVKVGDDETDRFLKRLVKGITDEQTYSRRYWYGYKQLKWEEFERSFVLLQSGVLVKETTRKKDRYGDLSGKSIGIEPKWTSSCSGYLDCLPGVLELTVSRNDVVEGKIPEQCLKAIDDAKAEALMNLRSRCEEIWKSAPTPTEQQRKLINATLEAFNAESFQDHEAWQNLIVNRYSLRGLRVHMGYVEQLLATAKELKTMLASSQASIFSVGEHLLEEWPDVLIYQESGDIIYVLKSGDTVNAALKFLGCRDLSEDDVLKKLTLKRNTVNYKNWYQDIADSTSLNIPPFQVLPLIGGRTALGVFNAGMLRMLVVLTF